VTLYAKTRFFVDKFEQLFRTVFKIFSADLLSQDVLMITYLTIFVVVQVIWLEVRRFQNQFRSKIRYVFAP